MGDIKPSHRGLLHEMLGVPMGQKIPVQKLEQAKRSKSPKMRQRANYALNVRK